MIMATAEEPGTINLSNGIYSPSSNDEYFPVVLFSDLSLTGESEDSVILDAEGFSRVVNVIGSNETFISSMTLINGNVTAETGSDFEENACIKARRYRQTAGKVIIFLKRNDYRAFGLETRLPRTSAFPLEIMPIIKKMFTAIYQDRTAYRATGVILTNLTESGAIQPSLFETFNSIKKTDHLYSAIDSLRKKYGKHTVHHAVSLPAQSSQHLPGRGDTPQRKTMLLKGENSRQRLPVPLIHVKV